MNRCDKKNLVEWSCRRNDERNVAVRDKNGIKKLSMVSDAWTFEIRDWTMDEVQWYLNYHPPSKEFLIRKFLREINNCNIKC